MAQALAQCQARIGSIDIELDRIEPLGDRGALGQWCRKMLGEQPRPRRSDGAVDGRQQASLALPGEAPHQLEVAPSRRVNLHDRAGHDAPWRFEICRLPLLGQADVINECAPRRELGAAEIAEPVERAHSVELLEPPAARVALEAWVRQRGQDRLPLDQQFEQCRAGQQPLGQQNLARRKAREIAGEGRLAGRRQRKNAGRQIEPGETHLSAGLGESRKIVVPARVQQPFLGHGAGGDDPDDRAPQHLGAAALGLGRVLDLVAYRDLEPCADQPGEIGLGGVHRHAAHRDIGALVPAALGQSDVERLRCGDGVFEKQLEEIAHPKE
jgi:hypothetical protein